MTTANACIAPGGPSLSGYKHHHCPCDDCLTENRTYNNQVRRLQTYGKWQPLVDAGPAREHIRTLRDQYSIERIAELANLGYATVNSIIHPINGKLRSRIRTTTADAILAVKPDPDLVRGGRPINSLGTRRRIEALAAVGWSLAEQSRQLGRDRHFADTILDQQQVTANTAREIRHLYDRLSDQPRLDADGRRIRWHASRLRWAPPAAWDDIDNPADTPKVRDEAHIRDPRPLIERVLAGRADLHILTSGEQAAVWCRWEQGRRSSGQRPALTVFAREFRTSRFRAGQIRAFAQASTPSHAAPRRTSQRKVA
jgi:hypothetical protein